MPAPPVNLPVAPNTNGAASSEYAVVKSSKLWSNIAMGLGLVTMFGSMIAQMFGVDSKWGIAAGTAVSIASQVQSTLTNLGYIKGRADIKVAQQQAVGTTSPTGDNASVTVNQK